MHDDPQLLSDDTIKGFAKVNKVHRDGCLLFHTLLKDISEGEYLFCSSPSLPKASLLLAQPFIHALLNSVDQDSAEDFLTALIGVIFRASCHRWLDSTF